MAIFYEIKERRVIPNWRDFKRTAQIGELNSISNNNEITQFDISRAKYDWNLNKNIGTASDLLNSAFVGEQTNNDDVKNALKFIIENRALSSDPLLQTAQQILKLESSPSQLQTQLLEKNVDTVQEFLSLENEPLFHRIIGQAKKKTKTNLRNAIAWVDLARLYTMKGQEIPAEKAMNIALYLAPNNRFVLRSATRLFIHIGEPEKALFYLKKSNSLKNDPWLVSAHVATSSVMDRYSPLIKTGEKMLESDNYSNFSITELSSSLGSLEFGSGSIKKARKLFKRSLLAPNDNTLAQIEWIAKEDNRFQIDLFEFNSVVNPFEAFSKELYDQGKFEEAFFNCIKWFLDMPFSKRPALLGGFIAGSLLDDKKSATFFTKIGLQANPHDPTLLNNMIYNLCTDNQVELAIPYVQQIREINIEKLPNEQQITIQATLGLVALRTGHFEEGLKFYKNSIDNSKRIKNQYLEQLATLNFTRELILAKNDEQKFYVEKVKTMEIDKRQKALIKLRENVLFQLKHTLPNKV